MVIVVGFSSVEMGFIERVILVCQNESNCVKNKLHIIEIASFFNICKQIFPKDKGNIRK